MMFSSAVEALEGISVSDPCILYNADGEELDRATCGELIIRLAKICPHTIDYALTEGGFRIEKVITLTNCEKCKGEDLAKMICDDKSYIQCFENATMKNYTIQCPDCRIPLIHCSDKSPRKYRTYCPVCKLKRVVTLVPSTTGCFWPVDEYWKEK